MATRKQTGDGIDPAMAKTLMDKLSNDDAFREAFRADPHGALESLGWKAPPGHKKAPPITKLASKETMAASRDAIEDKLCSAAPFSWPLCCDEFSAQ